MRSGKSIKSFIVEQYIEGIYSHLPINRPSNFIGSVRKIHIAFRNIPCNVNNEVTVVPDMGQRLNVVVSTDVAVTPDIR